MPFICNLITYQQHGAFSNQRVYAHFRNPMHYLISCYTVFSVVTPNHTTFTPDNLCSFKCITIYNFKCTERVRPKNLPEQQDLYQQTKWDWCHFKGWWRWRVIDQNHQVVNNVRHQNHQNHQNQHSEQHHPRLPLAAQDSPRRPLLELVLDSRKRGSETHQHHRFKIITSLSEHAFAIIDTEH